MTTEDLVVEAYSLLLLSREGGDALQRWLDDAKRAVPDVEERVARLVMPAEY